MSQTVRWKGIAYASFEECRIDQTDEQIASSSVINARYEGCTADVQYQVRTDLNRQFLWAEIQSVTDGIANRLVLEKNPSGWKVNGISDEKLKDCLTIDISLSPLTNTFVVRILGLQTGETQQITVVYIDVLAGSVKAVAQRYTKLGDGLYRYENVPNDFEADIRFGTDGLVTDYPGLFRRV